MQQLHAGLSASQLAAGLTACPRAQVYRGLVDAARGIVRQQGVRGLYSGLSVTLLEIVPYAALQFGLYDAFVSAHRQHRLRQVRAAAAAAVVKGPRQASEQGRATCAQGRDPEDKLGHFLCGLAAGALAKMATHPLDVAKKRFQVGALRCTATRTGRPGRRANPTHHAQVAGLQRCLSYGARVELGSLTSLPACLSSIYVREGLRGLYKGSIPSLVKAAPAAAITFSVYEAMLGVLAAAQARTGVPLA